ncbi:ABC transporter substrate-binding protein [Runella limosa]|uniref:ABC transporter substrate-binding protein n=1 Tax=Runella limosa TaxID=370978 RepID=UPI000408112D|nr:helical backbone metal receptor [Runella limosa]
MLFPTAPQRIVSLVPSQTELLFDLGLEGKVIGITKFCCHPADKVKNIAKIGGTKNFDFEKIKALRPDLIIGNKEENYQEGIETLQQDFPVWISDIVTLEESLEMIQKVGQLTHEEPEALNICQQLSTQFSSLQSPSRRPRVAYFIWKKPYMVAANGTFIHEMLRKAGFLNVFEDLTRYPEISEADLQQAAPELIFLSSEPYSFREKHLLEFQEICPSAHIMLVDGELFSWYGSRLLKSVAYFNELRDCLSKFFVS